MKRAGSFVMAAALLWAAGGQAQDDNSAAGAVATAAPAAELATTPDTPYSSIVARNMFALVPIPPPPDPAASLPPPDPPPKITPTGIMTIFHKDQAIFKVAEKAKPGQPAVELSHVLAEGEMDNDITVVKINRADGIITFNNHGTIQELPLVAAKDGGGGAAGGGPGAAPGPGNRGAALARLAGMNQQFGGGGLAPAQGRNQNNPGNANNGLGMGAGTAGNNLPNGITMLGDTPVNANRVYQPVADPNTSPEEAALLIEAQRLAAMRSGNKRLAAVLPPTPLTQQNIQDFQNSTGEGQ